MAANLLTPEARLENVKALALAAGISSEEAAERLAGRILCTFDRDDAAAVQFYREFGPILARTIETDDHCVDPGSYSVEVVVGDASPHTAAKHVFVRLRAEGCTISTSRDAGHDGKSLHSVLMLIAACYAVGVTIYHAVGREIPNPPPDQLEIRYLDIVPDLAVLNEPIALGEAYLAGAGAIGNGFVWAARYMDLHGTLTVSDDDIVSSGNLQRQIWFEQQDIGELKGPALCRKAQGSLPNCS